MSSLFIILFLITLVALFIGIANPNIFQKLFRKQTNRKTVGLSFLLLTILFLVLGGVTSASPHKNTNTAIVSKPKTSSPVITTKTVTTTTPIAFTTSTVQDTTLANGTTSIKTAGVNGVQTQTWKVTYSNGVETSRKSVSVTTTTQPVNEVIEHGTYVAPTPAPEPAVSSGSTTTSSGGCHPLTNGGNCYEAGEYCRSTDAGVTGVAGNGETITCEENNGLRWEPS